MQLYQVDRWKDHASAMISFRSGWDGSQPRSRWALSLAATVAAGAPGGGGGRLAGSGGAGGQLDRDRAAGDLAGGVDDLPDAVAVAVAQVVDLVPARLDRGQGKEVRLG